MSSGSNEVRTYDGMDFDENSTTTTSAAAVTTAAAFDANTNLSSALQEQKNDGIVTSCSSSNEQRSVADIHKSSAVVVGADDGNHVDRDTTDNNTIICANTSNKDDDESHYPKLVPTVSNDSTEEDDNEDDNDDSVSTTTITAAAATTTAVTTSTAVATNSVNNSDNNDTYYFYDDKPRKPVSAYHLFFQEEHEKAMASGIYYDRAPADAPLEEHKRRRRKHHWKLFFVIAEKWKRLDEDTKDSFKERAYELKLQYNKELEEWQQRNNLRHPQEVDQYYMTSSNDENAPPILPYYHHHDPYYDNYAHHQIPHNYASSSRKHKQSVYATKRDVMISPSPSKKTKMTRYNDTVGSSSKDQQQPYLDPKLYYQQHERQEDYHYRHSSCKEVYPSHYDHDYEYYDYGDYYNAYNVNSSTHPYEEHHRANSASPYYHEYTRFNDRLEYDDSTFDGQGQEGANHEDGYEYRYQLQYPHHTPRQRQPVYPSYRHPHGSHPYPHPHSLPASSSPSQHRNSHLQQAQHSYFYARDQYPSYPPHYPDNEHNQNMEGVHHPPASSSCSSSYFRSSHESRRGKGLLQRALFSIGKWDYSLSSPREETVGVELNATNAAISTKPTGARKDTIEVSRWKDKCEYDDDNSSFSSASSTTIITNNTAGTSNGLVTKPKPKALSHQKIIDCT